MIHVAIEPTELVANRVAPLAIRLTNLGRGPCTHVVLRLRLPATIALLEGSDRIEALRIDAGQSVIHSVRVRPRQPGPGVIVSSSFSYRDAAGCPQYPDAFRQEVRVLAPAPEPSLPAVSVELDTSELRFGEWDRLEGRLRNCGRATIHGAKLRAVGPITCDSRHPWFPIDVLHAGQAAEFSLPVRADERGARVPVHVEISYRDDTGRTLHHSQPAPVRVGVSGTARGQGQGDAPVTILFLSADPSNHSRLRLGQEFREIQERLQVARLRERFKLSPPRLSLRPVDLTQALLDVQPNIVHFSGHGTSEGRLCFEDDMGRACPIDPDALATLFEQFSSSIHCVLLNCCYSGPQAHAIASHIDYVIGMEKQVEDRAAIDFAVGFYQALGAGRSVEEAFGFGRTQSRLPRGSRSLAPVLKKRVERLEPAAVNGRSGDSWRNGFPL